MKPVTLIVLILFSLTGPASTFAEEHTTSEKPAETSDTDTTASSATTQPPRPAHSKGMMHQGKGPHGKGHGGMKHGGARQGKGHGGKKHCSKKHGDGGTDKHQQVVQRLDMIEARMAKMEAMLEIMMRR